MEQVLSSARELLIDLERHQLDAESGSLPPSPAIAALSPAAQRRLSSDGDDASLLTPPRSPTTRLRQATEHKEVLLSQLDRLRGALDEERAAADALRGENERLSTDLRALAQQLKQERAASNAVLAVRVGHDGGGEAAAAGGGAEKKAPPPPDAAGGVNGLTLASAASQILMLRREVKWLQKQLTAAKRDTKSSESREQMEGLHEAAREARAAADAAQERATTSEAQKRLLMRDLGRAKAQLAAQAARTQKRSAAQVEALSLRQQLQRAQQQLLAFENGGGGGGGGGGGPSGGGGGDPRDAALTTARVGLLLLRAELGTAETVAAEQARRRAHESDGLNEVRPARSIRLLASQRAPPASHHTRYALQVLAAKSALSVRLAEAEEDRSRLTRELTNLRERVAMMQEAQGGGAMRAAAPAPSGAPPPPPPPPPPMDGGGGPNLKEGMQNIGAKLGRMKFGIKK